jgi:hypothetical protein
MSEDILPPAANNYEKANMSSNDDFPIISLPIRPCSKSFEIGSLSF